MYQYIKVEVLKQFLKPVEHRLHSDFKNQYVVSKDYELYIMDTVGLTTRIHFIDEYIDGRIDLIFVGKIVDTVKQLDSWDNCITAMVLKVEKTVVEL
jgi:hypothetical protein